GWRSFASPGLCGGRPGHEVRSPAKSCTGGVGINAVRPRQRGTTVEPGDAVLRLPHALEPKLPCRAAGGAEALVEGPHAGNSRIESLETGEMMSHPLQQKPGDGGEDVLSHGCPPSQRSVWPVASRQTLPTVQPIAGPSPGGALRRGGAHRHSRRRSWARSDARDRGRTGQGVQSPWEVSSCRVPVKCGPCGSHPSMARRDGWWGHGPVVV